MKDGLSDDAAYFVKNFGHFSLKLGAVARSVVMPLGVQAVPRSITASGTSSRKGLVMQLFQRPFFLFR